MQTTSDGVLIFNNHTKIVVNTSPRASQLFGYDENELFGMPADKLIPLVQLAMPKEAVENQTNQNCRSTKLQGIKKSGEVFSIRLALREFQGGEELFDVAFIAEDLSQLQVAKGFVNEERSPIIFLILDNQANISLINNYGCELLGCPEETLRGLSWFENFLPIDLKPELKTLFDQAFTTGMIQDIECPVMNLNGEQYSIHWTSSMICNTAGTPVGILTMGVDLGKKVNSSIDLHHIERIKRLNEKLVLNVKEKTQELIQSLARVETINRALQLQILNRKATEQKLIKFQRLYDTMVHNFPDGVIGVLNRDMEYVLIDGKDLSEIDLPALGLNGKKVSDNQDPVVAAESLAKIKKAFEGQSVSFEVKTKDRFYNIVAVPLPDAQNNITEILCVLKNVTEKIRMEEGLVKALEKEKELGELKSRFVTMACHEFKTPLATILSSTFLLENYQGEDYAKEKIIHTKRIKRSVNNLTMILNEFLSLEKLEENEVKVIPTKINIQKFIREIIFEVEPVKPKNQIIDYKHSGDQQTACLDAHILWSIVTNLISNAVKYSKPDGKIDLTSKIEDNTTTIIVRDHGIGIPLDEQKHIYERFYRARNVINFDGTGLGLHIVEKNVSLLDGNISFSSQLNDGTEFTVTLPDGNEGRSELGFNDIRL